MTEHPEEYLSFRHADCGLLAIALHFEQGLPVYGLFEEGSREPHHVFVVDGEEVVDIDGRRAKEGALRQYQGDHVRPLTAREIDKIGGRYGDEEYDFACSVAETL